MNIFTFEGPPIRLCLRWTADGVVGHSEHANGWLVVRYLQHLHQIGDEVVVLSLA